MVNFDAMLGQIGRNHIGKDAVADSTNSSYIKNYVPAAQERCTHDFASPVPLLYTDGRVMYSQQKKLFVRDSKHLR